jgi:hypothetical protein
MTNLMCGRLPALMPAGLRELGYYSAGPLPAPPSSVAAPEVTDWGMLGNDTYGDCGVAGLEHGFMADAEVTHDTETFPDTDQAVDYYLAYTKGQDTGVVLSQYLQHVRQAGYYGHKVTAYAPVGVQDIPALHTVVAFYDFAYTGIRVTQAMQAAFQNGQPWDMETLLSPVAGGHCIPLVGYDDRFLYAITWGQVQAITYPAWHFIAEEAWAVITGELAEGDGRGINLAALNSDLDKLAA